MSRFHVTQDETGFFQLTYENDEGELTLVSHQFNSPKQLIEDAVQMAKSGDFGKAVVVIDPARNESRAKAASEASSSYRRPAPRKAGQ